MELGLKDKVALITGASRGIGKGIARSLAREGCKVALTARRADLLEAVSQAIRREFGVEAVWWTGDLLHTADADRVVNAAAAHFGRIDILVNNAGAAAGGVLEFLSDEAWEVGQGGVLPLTSDVMMSRRCGAIIRMAGGRIWA